MVCFAHWKMKQEYVRLCTQHTSFNANMVIKHITYRVSDEIPLIIQEPLSEEKDSPHLFYNLNLVEVFCFLKVCKVLFSFIFYILGILKSSNGIRSYLEELSGALKHLKHDFTVCHNEICIAKDLFPRRVWDPNTSTVNRIQIVPVL